MMRRYIAIMLSVVVLLCGLSSTVSAQDTVTYSLQIPPHVGVLKAGETVTVTVKVAPIYRMGMLQVFLYYDPLRFEAVDGTVGQFIDEYFKLSSVNIHPIDNKTGEPIKGVVILGGISEYDVAFARETVIGTVTLKARMDIHTDRDIVFQKAIASLASEEPLVCQTVNGTIDIIKGDIDDDGQLTLSDAMAVFTHINGTSTLSQTGQTEADTNNDGVIGLLDAMRLFYHVNGVC